jgi:hypothetical protein
MDEDRSASVERGERRTTAARESAVGKEAREMSWWVYLEQDGQSVTVPQFQEGGTQPVGGTTIAELNITYNYSPHYYEHLDSGEGLRWLHGRTGSACIERLRGAVAALGTDCNLDYWEATPGNAGYPLAILLWWAAIHPDAVFKVS